MKKSVYLIYNDIMYSYTKETTWISTISFFILIIFLFPVCIGPNTKIISEISIPIIWISMFLTSLLTLEKWFERDYQNGSIKLQMLSSFSIEYILYIRVFTHWLSNAIPLVLISPIMFMLLNIEIKYYIYLIPLMLLSGFFISLLGLLVSTLTNGLRQKNILVSIVIILCYIPIFIFTMLLIQQIVMGLSFWAPLMCLFFMFIIFFILCPLVSAQLLYRSL